MSFRLFVLVQFKGYSIKKCLQHWILFMQYRRNRPLADSTLLSSVTDKRYPCSRPAIHSLGQKTPSRCLHTGHSQHRKLLPSASINICNSPPPYFNHKKMYKTPKSSQQSDTPLLSGVLDVIYQARDKSTVKSFAVVKFLKTNTVDAVPTNWLERTEKTLLCYWPQKNVTAKVKRRETPDKTRWVKCKVNVLTYTDTYRKAREKVNQATITSNLESDQEEQTGRNIVIPARYLDSDTDIDEPSAKKIKKNPATSATIDHIQQMPTMPSFTPSMDLFSARHHQDSASLTTHLDVTSIRTVPHSSGNDPSNISGLNTTPGTPKACHKIHPTTLQKTVENCIADTLSYAPHRGTRVNNEGQSMRHNNEDAPEASAICRDHEDVSEESAMFEPAASD
ncbi:uncharacterized protein LOC130407535 [Triplophysa dalaica]|uniref:uncharacterized protein LOC130407535 n=1 Tax=Triplophysa dalaica TaxID=1582913 RepID=UPI0024E03B1A|nr:uncharacterized protein LOC130407535 [Triplophysa dalaica]